MLTADYVTTDDGTGIVHIAPAFGEDDKAVTDAAGIEVVVPVGSDGKFTSEVAPYAAHLVELGVAREPRVREVADRLHRVAVDAGREILYDDRDESPGVKFTDAELLGMPTILTVSPRSLGAGGVEVTDRRTGERTTRSIDEVEAMLTGSEVVPA